MIGSRGFLLARCRVLVVEDEYFLADDVASAIAEEGGEICGPAATLPDALALVERQRPDLAVMDVRLRDRPVYDLADRLVRAAVPFLFATGYERAALPERFRQVPFLRKPLSRTALIEALVHLRRQAA